MESCSIYCSSKNHKQLQLRRCHAACMELLVYMTLPLTYRCNYYISLTSTVCKLDLLVLTMCIVNEVVSSCFVLAGCFCCCCSTIILAMHAQFQVNPIGPAGEESDAYDKEQQDFVATA